jgi:hypothetical protein
MREPDILTQQQLNAAGCSTPDCGHDHSTLHLSPQCHPGSPSFASYDKSDGTLTMTCAVCDELVTRVLIARALQ